MRGLILSILIVTGSALPGEEKPKTIPLLAQKYDMNAILKEVMKFDISTKSDHMNVAFWAPFEFIQAAGRASSTPDKFEEIDKAILVLKKYQIFLIRRSYKDEQGLTRVISSENLHRTVTLILKGGIEFRPIKELPAEIAGTVSAFKRGVEANSQGIEYSTVVFSNLNKSGSPIISAYDKNTIELVLQPIAPMELARFSWSTPLDSLSSPQVCLKCTKELSAAWNYCPWDGTKILDSEK